jgi:hypothetical protein
MTKLIVAASTAIALLGIATIGLVASEGVALAKPTPGFVCTFKGYFYSVEQPDWSKQGVPCWRPWEMNPMLKFRASHDGHA